MVVEKISDKGLPEDWEHELREEELKQEFKKEFGKQYNEETHELEQTPTVRERIGLAVSGAKDKIKTYINRPRPKMKQVEYKPIVTKPVKTKRVVVKPKPQPKPVAVKRKVVYKVRSTLPYVPTSQSRNPYFVSTIPSSVKVSSTKKTVKYSMSDIPRIGIIGSEAGTLPTIGTFRKTKKKKAPVKRRKTKRSRKR